jgi:hypothetical protein
MSQQPIGRNTPCPCGSGKKYKQCCLKRDVDWVENDDGTIRRSIPISEDLQAELQEHREGLEHDLGQKAGPANLEEMPSEAEQAAAIEMIEHMNPGAMEAFRELADQYEDVDEFIDMIMIGPCPKCESEATTHCEDDPEIDDATVGRCKECGQLFCPDCGELFPVPAVAVLHDCPAWEEMESELDEPF